MADYTLTDYETGAEVQAALNKAGSALQAVLAGVNVSIDNTDPQRPIISFTGPFGVSAPPSDDRYYAYRNGGWVDITNKIVDP